MTAAEKITVELSPTGEYPPGEEWRARIREAVDLLGQAGGDQWVKVSPIEPGVVSLARAAAHNLVKNWTDPDDNEPEYKLITRYYRDTQTFWMTVEAPEEDEE